MKNRHFPWTLLVVCLILLVLCAGAAFHWLRTQVVAGEVAAFEETPAAENAIEALPAGNVIETPPDAGALPKDRAALRKQVESAFEARQKSLRSELSEFRGRLERLSQTLQERERTKGAIIEHRVDELLNPNLRWNAETSRQETSPKALTDSMFGASDLVPSKELLDTLERRWSLVEAQLKSGNATIGDVLKVDQELALSRLEAARNPTQRWATYVEQLKRQATIKGLAEKLVDAGEATSAEMLAVDTSILRTKQQMAREFPAGRTDLDHLRDPMPTSQRGSGDMIWGPPRGTDETRPQYNQRSEVFRSASDFQRMFARALTGGQAEAAELPLVCAEFSAQLNLLKIDLDEAQAAYRVAKNRLDALSEAYKAGEVSQSKVLDATSALDSAKARLMRGETLLSLYHAKPLMELHQTAQKAIEESQKSALARLTELLPGLKPLDTAPDAKAADLIWNVLGAKVKMVARDTLPDTRYSGGLQIVELRADSPAAKAGLRGDDVLLGLHHWETVSPEGLAFVLNHADARPGPEVTVKLRALVLRGKDSPLILSISLTGEKPSLVPEEESARPGS